jgi:hypothetical protein
MKKLLLLCLLPLAAHSQSLLDPQETEAQKIAREVLDSPRSMRDTLLNALDYRVSRLWSAPNPQAVLDEIGTKGRDLFEINEAFASTLQALLQSQNDSEGLTRLDAIIAKIKPCTIHANGSVTINPEPTPTPEN